MATFEDFLSEGKKIQIKRQYTENHPAHTVGKDARVRNAVLKAIKDGVVTEEEFNTILSELSSSPSRWRSTNSRYFFVSEEGIKLSKWGRRILAELDETPKAAEVFEATVEMDALDPDNKDFLKFLKKNRVKIINKVMDGPGGGTPVITMQGKRKDLETVLADSEFGWDDPDLAEYIEESVNEKIQVTKDKFPYIEFKEGGKKYEVEFDQGDIIDNHGNEGKDWYYVGVDQFGDEWEIDVYTDYRDEPEDWFYDTIKRANESVVTEGKVSYPRGKQYRVSARFTDKDDQDTFAETYDLGRQSSNYARVFANEEELVEIVKDLKNVYGLTSKDITLHIKGKNGDYDFWKIDSQNLERHLSSDLLSKLQTESVVTENYEVIYSDGVSAIKKFRTEKQALDFMKQTIASNKKLRDIAVYKPGMHSTTQTELVVKFWGDGSYLDNVSKKDAELAAKKVEESTITEGLKFGKKGQYSIDDVNEAYGFWGTLEAAGFATREIEDAWLSAHAWLTVAWKFSDAGALYFLNAKIGRWVADQVAEKKDTGEDVVDVLEAFANSSQWKKWAKEYNEYAQEELAENTNTNMKSQFLFESFADFVGANFVNEALGSQILSQVFMSNRQGTYAKQNLSVLAKGFYGYTKVALDKIQDEDFIVSHDPQKVFNNYGASHIIFFVSDNEKENPYAPADAYSSQRVVPGGGVLLAAMSGDKMFFSNEWSRWSGGGTWKKEKKGNDSQIGINHKYRGWDATGLNNGKRIAEVSDRAIVVNVDLLKQKYSTEQLRAARAEAKAGATAFQSDKDFKKANSARYHQILSQKAASLPLDTMVEEAIDKLTKQIQDGLKAGEKTQWNEIKIGQSPKGRDVKARDAASHMSSILDDYERYCDYIKQAEQSEERYGERESYYERESKDYAKRIKDKINQIDTFDYAW